MKCQGRPEDGRCPENRNDSTVHNTIGDIFLCYSCEEYRWPTAATAGSTAARQTSKHNVVNLKQTVETRSSTARAKKTPSSSSSSNSRDQELVHDSLSAAGNDKSTRLSTDDTSCAHCNDVINSACLKCDICDNTYHGHCTAIPLDVISVLLTIASQCGWVCEPCRSACRGKLLRMSAAQTKAAEDVACLTTTVSEMRNEIQKLETKINSVVLNNNNSAVNETETRLLITYPPVFLTASVLSLSV